MKTKVRLTYVLFFLTRYGITRTCRRFSDVVSRVKSVTDRFGARSLGAEAISETTNRPTGESLPSLFIGNRDFILDFVG